MSTRARSRAGRRPGGRRRRRRPAVLLRRSGRSREHGRLVEWGPNVSPIFTDPAAGDPGLIENFVSSKRRAGDIGGVLAQYMDQRGNAAPSVTYGGEYPITPSVTSSTIDDQQIPDSSSQQIESGKLPEPVGRTGSGRLPRAVPSRGHRCLDSGDHGCSGTSFCAYHGNATLPDGTAVLYAVLPDDTTGPMSRTAGPGERSAATRPRTSATSGRSRSPIRSSARRYPEATYPLAWYDDNCSIVDAICGEIGDKCNQHTGRERRLDRPARVEQPRRHVRERRAPLQRPDRELQLRREYLCRAAARVRRHRIERPDRGRDVDDLRRYAVLDPVGNRHATAGTGATGPAPTRRRPPITRSPIPVCIRSR